MLASLTVSFIKIFCLIYGTFQLNHFKLLAANSTINLSEFFEKKHLTSKSDMQIL